MAECGKQFVGRRKMGGGYTYYDFLQNRHFDIAGPNPTPKELRYFDEQYTSYLDAQRQEAVAAALAEKQNRMAQPDLQDDRVAGSISPPGLPVVIAPTNVPIPRARSSVVRSDGVCEDTSLSCNWTKFSAGIKKFFESNAEVTALEQNFVVSKASSPYEVTSCDIASSQLVGNHVEQSKASQMPFCPN